MLVKMNWLLLIAGVLHLSSAKIPSYIKVCKRNDPKIDQCITNSINHLRPKLVEGIPELDVPSIDPMYFDEFVVSKAGSFKAVGTHVYSRGGKNYKITSLKSDVNKLVFDIGLSFPYLNITNDYDVDMKLLGIVLKGHGPMVSNNSDVTAKCKFKGHKYQKNGATYVQFDTFDMKIDWKDYDVKLENLFGGDKLLGDAVNIALNENKKEMIELIKPTVGNLIGEKFLEIGNNICNHFTYDELFPLK